MLSVLQSDHFTVSSVVFAALAFVLVIAIWWQYFENMEKHVDKSKQTAGQTIMYGHLFIYLSLSMLAASIQLLFLGQVAYIFVLCFTFASVLIYFLSVLLVFHRYRLSHLKPSLRVIFFLAGVLCVLFILNLFIVVPSHLIVAEIMLFFILFAKMTVHDIKG
jgi:low temperature requirement protein LtrA